jgi:superfamily II DNA or RNA helicase
LLEAEPERLPNGRKRVKDTKTSSDYAKSYSKDVVQNVEFNRMVSNLIKNLIDANIPTLCLTKQVTHGVTLQDMLMEDGYHVPFAEGKSETKSADIAAFNACEVTGLVGTTGVLGEGVDTKPCEYVLLAGGGKSKNQFMQNCGRAFRRFQGKESGKIVLFKNPNNKWLLDHFNQCLKYLEEEYGVIAQKLEIE